MNQFRRNQHGQLVYIPTVEINAKKHGVSLDRAAEIYAHYGKDPDLYIYGPAPENRPKTA